MNIAAHHSMMNGGKKVPALTDFFDCGWYGSSGYGGRYFVNTFITGLIGTTTKIETTAYWTGGTSGSTYGNWNPLFCAQSADGASDTIQIRRRYTGGTLCSNNSDNTTIAIPTSANSVVLDGANFSVGNTTKTGAANYAQCAAPLVLGGSYGIIYSSNVDRLKRCWHGFIGRTKVFVEGKLIADMCPMADGGGFYDLMRNITLPKTDIRTL